MRSSRETNYAFPVSSREQHRVEREKAKKSKKEGKEGKGEGFWSNKRPNASIPLVEPRSKASTLLLDQTIIK